MRTMRKSSSHLWAAVGAVGAGLGLASLASAAVVFESDFDSAANVVNVGGTGVPLNSGGIGQTVTVESANPLGAAGGSYLHVVIAGPASGGETAYMTYAPTDAQANSWGALYQGTISSGGKTWANLAGGYDSFIRMNSFTSQSGLTGGVWYGNAQATASLLHPLAIQFQTASDGSNDGSSFKVQIHATSSGGNAITNYTKVIGKYGGNGGTEANLYPDTALNLFNVAGQITHVGFTFNTDSNGLITLREFARKDNGAIDTSDASPYLIGKATFQIDASAFPATNVFATGGGDPGTGPNANGGLFDMGTLNADVDSIRLYNADPGTFAGLGAIPEPASLSLLAGLVGVIGLNRRRRA